MAGVAEALMGPFQWGNAGRKKTRAEVESDRAVAAALAAKSGAPQNVGDGLNRIGEALRYNALSSRAGEAETAGRASYDELFKGLDDGYDRSELMGLVGNEWADPAQQSVAQALLQQDMRKSDPEYALDLELKQAQLDAARAPAERKYEKDAGGVQRYIDTGEPLFPDGMAGDAPPNVKGESDLRDEYNKLPTTSDFQKQASAYQRLLDSASDPSPAGDIAMIFNYMKILDPGSVVREQEFATAQNAGSIPERIRAQYNSALEGTLLTPTIRKDYLKRAGDLFGGAASLQETNNSRYSTLATEYGYNPARIVNPVPKIGVLDPEFKIDEYVDVETGTQTKPIPLTEEKAQQEYDALPSGAVFVGPDGKKRVKP